MRIFNSLARVYTVTQDQGWYLSKRKATLLASKFQMLLELRDSQKRAVQQYLEGIPVDLDAVMTPKECETVTGFLSWFNHERSPVSSQTVYIAANLNTGHVLVFNRRLS